MTRLRRGGHRRPGPRLPARRRDVRIAADVCADPTYDGNMYYLLQYVYYTPTILCTAIDRHEEV